MNQEVNKMSRIPKQIEGKKFKKHIEPYLSKAKRGFVCRVSLEKVFNAILYKLYTGCQWKAVHLDEETAKVLSYQAIYWHYRKWSKDGSIERVWKHSLKFIEAELNLSELNTDGSHTIAKK